ncbi:acyltransferase [Shewanella sp.]|uniref:acyltransferase n=1 Tax=Shewanella sp. TaxID=50422 RepID=UPI003A97682E
MHIVDLVYMPMSNKFNLIKLFLHRIKTKFFYGILLNRVGAKAVIYNPLLLVNANRISLGSNVLIRDYARIEVVGDGFIDVGNNVSIEQFFHATAGGRLMISDNVTISFGAMVTDIDHEYRLIGKHILSQPHVISETFIGENCFIGASAKIQAGTILGKQCIVGANSVVRGHFPDYCVLVGTPAKIVKRYNPESGEWERVKPDGNFYEK